MSQPRTRSGSASSAGLQQGSPKKASSRPDPHKASRERAPSFASMQSAPMIRVLNEKVSIISETPGCATYEITDEDHTLGNILRIVAMKDPSVVMAAYFVPHPLESRMHLRIETKDGVEPTDVLIRTLGKVMDMCDEFTEKFNASLADIK